MMINSETFTLTMFYPKMLNQMIINQMVNKGRNSNGVENALGCGIYTKDSSHLMRRTVASPIAVTPEEKTRNFNSEKSRSSISEETRFGNLEKRQIQACWVMTLITQTIAAALPIRYRRSKEKETIRQSPLLKGVAFAKHLLLYSTVLLFSLQPAAANCKGRFVNPLTDICWSCIFPMTIGGVNVSGGGHADTPNPSGFMCLCPKPPFNQPTPGVPVSFWEPARLVDVTRTPYCLINMGGIQMAGGNRMQGRGTVVHKGHSSGLKRSFYQVHWYVYPVIYWLELLVDFVCLEKASIDLVYLTELDPLWNDEETGFILNPEAVLFGNPIAQAACAVDCGLASVGFPNDALFWCGGCQGSLYPFSGSIPARCSSQFIGSYENDGQTASRTSSAWLYGKPRSM